MPPDDFYLTHPRAWKSAPSKGLDGCTFATLLWLTGAVILLAVGAAIWWLVSVF